MTTVSALEREWAAKLRASGFRDLEGRDRDGPLSDRGNLHVVIEAPREHARLVERIEHGSAYYTWASGVLHTHRFASRLERDVWACEVEGIGIKGASRKLGISFHRARVTMRAVRAAIALTGRQGNQGRKPCRRELRRLIERVEPATLLHLARVLIQARP